MKDLTIIMPFLNEGEEPLKTIESVYETAPKKKIDIIAIDDGYSLSKENSNIAQMEIASRFPDVKYIRNKVRIGVDGSRQIGAELSKTPYLLIIDAHMRFLPGWLDKILDCVSREPQTLWCTTCLALGYGNMDIHRAKDKYYGADLILINKDVDPNRPVREILEPKWAERKNGIEYEIPCVLGANYACNKNWFHYVHGLSGLKMWGTSEPFLSLKFFLSGGKCKITTNVEIGHKFRDNAPYSTNIWSLIYNKIYLCKTILPDELSKKLIDNFPQDSNFKKAMKVIDGDKEKIEQERQYYKSIFTKSIKDYCREFDIVIP